MIRWSYVDTFLIYDLYDYAGARAGIGQKFFGLFNADWTPKPAVAAGKQALSDLR